ncbi:cytochrome-c oxidase, cbb3-type subunit II [Maritimibacter fusiformis]|uniref:Cytochrome-c oxidase, cbb3-type subunit II n=1 Tax=Maritimibacter fusiformis TaxID=2603819 RepID=A0A5D0RKU5_9RHOB|nr:cytochrome-c oxidase, cbb3-type subunit II [Maritimibacter fusiformis]TYB81134.1 cytochrome-c oxidase, cbb3-type subunit II [Maritimibacter fusiformis]
MIRWLQKLYYPIQAGHYRLEKHSIGLTLAIIFAAMIGGFVEIAPLFTIDETVEEAPDMRLYTPLEQAGRDIYIREGCYACHSQMIRTLVDEVDRYGAYSLAVESKYDHPMLWGSKRTGPDLARLGGKYSDDWHVAHLIDPRAVVPESVMPHYAFLAQRRLETESLPARLAALGKVGVPYDAAMIENAERDARGQANPDSDDAGGVAERYGEATQIRPFDGDTARLTEMDALVAYLQILGKLTDAASRIETAAIEADMEAAQ